MERAVGLIFILSPPFTVVPTRSETSAAVTDVIYGTPRLTTPGAAIHIIQAAHRRGKRFFVYTAASVKKRDFSALPRRINEKAG